MGLHVIGVVLYEIRITESVLLWYRPYNLFIIRIYWNDLEFNVDFCRLLVYNNILYINDRGGIIWEKFLEENWQNN